MENERRYYDEVEQKYTEHEAHDAVEALIADLANARASRDNLIRDLTMIAAYIGTETSMSAVTKRLGQLLQAEKDLARLNGLDE